MNIKLQTKKFNNNNKKTINYNLITLKYFRKFKHMCFVSRYIPDKHLKNVSLNIQFVLLQIACLLHSHYVFLFEVVFCFVDIIILRLKD